MTFSTETNKFAQVVHKIDPDSTLLRAWPLQGGVSAQVTALEIARSDGQIQKMVVRQHGEMDRQQNPQIATTEFKLLQYLQAVGLAAPRPYYLDQSGDIFPIPYLITSYIEGTTANTLAQVSGLIPQLALYLANIHRISCSQLDIPFLPHQAQICAAKLSARPSTVDNTFDEGAIRDILEAAWPFPQRNASVLLHGDFWPGNVLCQGDQLAAVIDWEDANVGDPLADLANSRLEILWAFGYDAMYNFTAQYQAMAPIDYTNLPYWDLYTALRLARNLATWGADESTKQRLRADYQWFCAQAFSALGSTENTNLS